MNTPLGSHIAAGSKRGGMLRKTWVSVLAVALIPAVGVALATSVTLNSGNGIEFGQGSQQTIACDTSIATAIHEAWYQTGGVFEVSTIELSTLNINTSTANNGGCGGKTLKISLLDSSGTALVIGTSSATSTSVTVPTSDGSATTTNGLSSALTNASASSGTVGVLTITLPATIHLDATSVYRIAIESQI